MSGNVEVDAAVASPAEAAAVPDAAQRYADRAARHARDRDAESRRSVLVSRLRLGTFLPAAACLVWALARGVTPAPVATGVVLFFAFGALVVWHARIEERVAWHDALRIVNLRSVARLARRWEELPPGDAPSGVDLAAHPYAQDLDVFGRASLFQWLGPAATVGGGRLLAGWLMRPAPRDEILQRQQAVATLAPLDGWREGLAAHGVLASDARAADLDRFIAWTEGDDAFGLSQSVVAAAVILILGSFWALLLLDLFGIIRAALWGIPLVAGVGFSLTMSGRIQAALDRAGGGQRALARYAALFEHALARSVGSPRLENIRERLSAGKLSAPACMRQLNRILGFGELRRSAALLHFPIHAVTLWDFHVVFALDRWRRRAGRRVRGWLEALGELDALALFASAKSDNPGWCTPAISTEPVFDAEALGHPLLSDTRRVSNDVTVGPPGTILLVTGSNMSGKSTLLRAIGLNLVLAQAGACVCARRCRLPEADLQSSIRVQDSLELGLSYFMAALARLKGVVDAAEHERPGRVLVYLLDEILQGTNSVERGLAVRAVARHLLDAGAIGAMTTHDLSLAAEEPLKSAARLVHFTETVDEAGEMRFDYRLRPGLATSRNALRLMQLIGIKP